jgi:hypothetical protein
VCGVQLTVVGCGFYPNEATIVCQGFADETGLPLQRPGKTVTNTMQLECDTDGNGTFDLAIPMVNVTPLNRNAVRGDLRPAPPSTPIGTAFPLTCCGGIAQVRERTSFSAGDNNAFGAFTRDATCTVDLGVRAPVVISATPAGPVDCSINQNILISGACFLGTVTRPGTPQTISLTVTSVFAVERGNPANVVPARTFTILSANLIDADFLFGSANAGKTFLIFATGPGGQSRNLTALPAGAQFCPSGYTSGNENGIQVTITCQAPPAPRDVPTLTSCALERTDAGGFVLVVSGSNIKAGAAVTVSGQTPRRVKFRGETSPGSGVFTRLVLKGICGLIPGPIVVTNPGATGGASQPLQCNERCPSS